MKNRAATPEQKRAVVERILRVWQAQPHLRLGQLLVNLAPGNQPNSPLYYVEDEDLVQFLEQKKELRPSDRVLVEEKELENTPRNLR